MPKNVVTWACDADGVITFIADNVADLLGYTATEAQAHRPVTVPPKPGGWTFESVLAEEKKKNAPPFSFRSWRVKVVHKDGESVPIELVAVFQRDHGGRLTGAVGAAWQVCCPLCQAQREGQGDYLTSAVRDMATVLLGLV